MEDRTAGRTVVLLPWKKSRLSGLDVFRTRLSVLKFLDWDSGLYERTHFLSACTATLIW